MFLETISISGTALVLVDWILLSPLRRSRFELELIKDSRQSSWLQLAIYKADESVEKKSEHTSEQRWNIMAKNHSNCSKHSSFSQCVPEELELEVLVLKSNPKAEYTRLTTRCVYQRTRQPTTQPVMELLEGMLRWGRRAGFVCFLVFFVFGLSCVGGDAKVRKNRLTPALIECSRALKLP